MQVNLNDGYLAVLRTTDVCLLQKSLYLPVKIGYILREQKYFLGVKLLRGNANGGLYEKVYHRGIYFGFTDVVFCPV